MTDIPGIYGMSGGNMEVTTAGGQYLPSLSGFYGPKPLDLDDLQAPWEAEAIFAFDDRLNSAGPVVIHDTSTGGRIAVFFQTVGPEYYRERHQGNDIPKGEVISDYKKRVEGIRVKHRVGANSVKMYDKGGQNLRLETTINNTK